MKRVVFGVLLLAAASWSNAAEPLQLLKNITAAAEKINYSGVFVYQRGNSTETSRIVHVWENGQESERLQVLDGSPREVVLENQELKCILPESHLVVVEGKSKKPGFPQLSVNEIDSLNGFYVLKRGQPSRVADFDAQMYVLEPRDKLRFGRQFWIEPASSLLLKSTLLDEKGDVRETFAFTELKIGNAVDRNFLKQGVKVDATWRVHMAQARPASGDDVPWKTSYVIPGFSQVSIMKRTMRPNSPELLHVLYSDGVASVSVFTRTINKSSRPEKGGFGMGGMNIYRRVLGDWQLVLMGDVPASVLKQFGDGIEVKP